MAASVGEDTLSGLEGELLEAARRMARVLGPPPVVGVHVPLAEAGPRDHAEFCAVELADGSTGLAYALLGDTPERLREEAAQVRAGAEAAVLAEGLAGRDPAARALGLAALNALTRHLYDRARFAPEPAQSPLGPLLPGRRVGMVGFFPPLVRRAREAGIPLTVIELKEDLVQEGPGLTVTLDPARLAGCEDVVCTSAALLNGSLPALLAHARGCRTFTLVGPSAGCVPDPLFARGVTALGGAWVVDPAALLARAARGERWGDAVRKFTLGREGWPGLGALLARAGR